MMYRVEICCVCGSTTGLKRLQVRGMHTKTHIVNLCSTHLPLAKTHVFSGKGYSKFAELRHIKER